MLRSVKIALTVALFGAVCPFVKAQNAVTPGELSAVPTLRCIGLRLPLTGDANGNAAATVEFREAGKDGWKKAMPLLRVLVKDQNYLAGSILGLLPGRKYEVRVAQTDPDGGKATRTLSVSTRPVPAIPTQGNVIHVRGGGDALKAAVLAARPGDIFLVHAGKYTGPVIVKASGTPAKPIVIRSAGDGEAIILGPKGDQAEPRWGRKEDREGPTDCVNLAGSHIRFHEMSVHGGFIGIYHGVRRSSIRIKDVSVTRCKITGCHHALFGRASASYFADNVLRGTYKGGNEGEGIEVNGVGNVICYNQITHFADAISVYRGASDCDVYNNNAIHHGDDAIEVDYSGPNTRIFDNRFSYTGANGISFQPYVGGPCYVVRNLVFNVDENTVKDRYGARGAVFINNTMVAYRANSIIRYAFARNNLFITYGGQALRYHAEDLKRNPRTLDLDHNGYNAKLAAHKYQRYGKVYGPQSVAEFHAAHKMETHGVGLTVKGCFAKPLPTQAEFRRIVMRDWTGFPHPDFSLKAGSPAIDRGIAIPNIAETYKGKAPDLGALEFGLPAPHWGPRKR